MMKIQSIILFLAISTGVFAQQDTKAKEILNQLSAKTKAYKTMKVDFSFDSGDLQKHENISMTGNVLIKGKKYKLSLKDNVVYFDGKTMWNFLKESNEVNVSEPKEKKTDDFFLNNPMNFFTIYEKDYKLKFIEERPENGTTICEIDLYPVDIKKKYSRIKLLIDKTKMQLFSVRTYMNDGTRYAITIKKLTVNEPAEDSEFGFNEKAHPGVEVIDMRMK
jgi:outer membrane lipoprotein-sorting protein